MLQSPDLHPGLGHAGQSICVQRAASSDTKNTLGRKGQSWLRAGGKGPAHRSRSLVQMSAVIGALDVDPADPLDALTLLVLLQVVGAPGCPPGGLQQRIVGTSAVLGFVEQDVQGLFVDSGFWEFNLEMPNGGRGR